MCSMVIFRARTYFRDSFELVLVLVFPFGHNKYLAPRILFLRTNFLFFSNRGMWLDGNSSPCMRDTQSWRTNEPKGTATRTTAISGEKSELNKLSNYFQHYYKFTHISIRSSTITINHNYTISDEWINAWIITYKKKSLQPKKSYEVIFFYLKDLNPRVKGFEVVTIAAQPNLIGFLEFNHFSILLPGHYHSLFY